MRRRAAALLLVTVALAALTASAACGSDVRTVTGFIVDVTPQSIDAFSSLTVRDGSGTIYTFQGGRFPAFTPSHLLEHRIAGEKIKVEYRVTDDGKLEVISISDG